MALGQNSELGGGLAARLAEPPGRSLIFPSTVGVAVVVGLVLVLVLVLVVVVVVVFVASSLACYL